MKLMKEKADAEAEDVPEAMLRLLTFPAIDLLSPEVNHIQFTYSCKRQTFS